MNGPEKPNFGQFSEPVEMTDFERAQLHRNREGGKQEQFRHQLIGSIEKHIGLARSALYGDKVRAQKQAASAKLLVEALEIPSQENGQRPTNGSFGSWQYDVGFLVGAGTCQQLGRDICYRNKFTLEDSPIRLAMHELSLIHYFKKCANC
mgnify:CR=1 FL=1